MTSRKSVLTALSTLALAAAAGAFGPVLPSPIMPAGANEAKGLAMMLPTGCSPLQIDANLVAALPKDGVFTLIGFPLEDGRFVDLELERFEPIPSSAQIMVGSLAEDGSWIQEPGDHRPTVQCFRGRIAGQPDSSAFLALDASTNEATIVDEREGIHVMSDGGVDARGPLLMTKMRALPEGYLQFAPRVCATPSQISTALTPPPMQSQFMPPEGCKMLEIAIETDREFLRDSFGGNRANALNYIAKLMGGTSTVYLKEFNIDVEASFVRLWAATGTGYPYRSDYSNPAVGIVRMATDLNTRWATSDTGVTRDIVAMLSPQQAGGGIAYGIGGVCQSAKKAFPTATPLDPTTAAGYCVCANFDMKSPYPLERSVLNWDITTLMHEVGHVMGARHTHDFPSDNYDDCIVGNNIGPCTLKSQGTIMSYCHLCPGGNANIGLEFTSRNKDQVATRVSETSCVTSCTGAGAPSGFAGTCTSAGVSLSWGAVTGAKGYVIYRLGDTEVIPTRSTTAAGVLSKIDVPGTGVSSYRYVVRALITKAASPAPGTSDLFEGPASDEVTIAFPSKPTDLIGTFDADASEVTLSWTASSGATTYNVYRGLGSATPTLLANVATTTYVDTLSTSPKRIGTYYVKAVNEDACESIASDSVMRGWGVTDLAVTSGTRTDGVELTWTAVPTAAAYKILRLTASSGSPTTQIDVAAAGDVSYLDTSASVGTFYSYAIITDFGTADGDTGNVDVGWRNASAPAGFGASDGSQNNFVRLSWTPSTGAMGYVVFRSSGSGEPAAIKTIAGGSVSTFDDATAWPDILYTYFIKARTTAGEASDPKIYSEASTTDGGFSNLGPPTGVVASMGGFTTKVRVSFVNRVLGALGYNFYRSTGGGDPELIGTLPLSASTLAIEDTSAVVGQLYSYTVRAIGNVTETDPSSSVDGWRAVGATSRVTASDGTSAGSISITWEQVPLSNGYVVKRSTGGGTATTIATKTSISQTSHTDTASISPGTAYTYSIIATYPDPTDPSAKLQSPVGTSDTGWATLAAPTGVTATQGTSTALVEVRWSAVTGATMYQIERRSDTSSYLVVVPKRMFTTRIWYDRTAVPGKRYCYIVRAAASAGLSPASLPACGWRLNPNGPNPSTTDDGSGSSLRVADGGQAGGAPTSGAAGRGRRTAGDETTMGDGAAVPGDSSLDDALTSPIDPSDPARQLNCLDASLEEMLEAVQSGARDADGDGQPDLCQRERGDLDLNGHVDAGDVVLLLLMLGDETAVMGDFNQDGCVDRADLEHLQDLVTEQAELDALEASLPLTEHVTPD